MGVLLNLFPSIYSAFFFFSIDVLAAPNRQTDVLWSCPTTPVDCLPPAPNIHPWDLCGNDTDCDVGERCCYHGCIKRCIAPNPCDRVVCAEGYACREDITLCDSPPCAPQATCISEDQARCPTLHCTEKFCPAGYERARDSRGCTTCVCVKKKECRPTCSIYCVYGHVMKDGCPICDCLPEPEGPCTNVTCGSNEECRLVESSCNEYPCLPKAACVPDTPISYDDTCGMLQSTTQGRPVMEGSSNQTTVNCSTTRCPDHTVCTAMEEGLFLCCWQYTQSRVSPAPKIGQCPQLFLTQYLKDVTTQCEIDHDCPGKQKCCYRQRSVGHARHYGICLEPEHVYLGQKSLCGNAPDYLMELLTYLKLCRQQPA